jgi:hypothetical protein
MSEQAIAVIYLAVLAGVNLAFAAYAVARPRTLAAYGVTPEADSDRLRRNAWLLVLIDLALIGGAALFAALQP